MSRRLTVFVLIVLAVPAAAMAQRRGNMPRGPIELQRAVDIIKDWGQVRASEGNRACHLQAVLNALTEIDNVMDPMQPNVSISKANDRLVIANRNAPQGNDSVAFSLHALLITAGQILDPHASPDIPRQKERFHREVLEPAERLITPEIIAFVESAQQLDIALRAVSQTQSDMSAMILHAIHGDCAPPPGR